MRLRCRRPRLADDRRGAAALEFALVASAFLGLLILLLEMAWQMVVAAALDHGAREASRWAITGQGVVPVGTPVATPILVADGKQITSREEEVLRLLTTASGLNLRGSLGVTIRAFPSFAAAGAANLPRCGSMQDGVSGTAGGSSAVVRYDVAYQSAGLTPLGRSLLPAGILSHCVVLLTTNEPFPE